MSKLRVFSVAKYNAKGVKQEWATVCVGSDYHEAAINLVRDNKAALNGSAVAQNGKTVYGADNFVYVLSQVKKK
jgi:hypothetical protein